MSTSELQLEPQHVNGGPPGCAAAHAEDAHVLEEPLPQEQPLPPPPPVGKADVVSPLTSAGSSGSDETTGSASELGAGDPAEPMHEAVTAEVAVATESSPAAAQDGAEEAPQRQKEVVPNETLRDGAPTPLAQLPTPATTSASSLSSQTDMSSISGGNSSSTVSISHSTTQESLKSLNTSPSTEALSASVEDLGLDGTSASPTKRKSKKKAKGQLSTPKGDRTSQYAEDEPMSPAEAAQRTAMLVLRRRSYLAITVEDPETSPSNASATSSATPKSPTTKSPTSKSPRTPTNETLKSSSPTTSTPLTIALSPALSPAADVSPASSPPLKSSDTSDEQLQAPKASSPATEDEEDGSDSDSRATSEDLAKPAVVKKEPKGVYILPGETPKDALDRVLKTNNLKLLGDYLGSKGDFYTSVLQEFLNTYDFVGVTIDYALRQFLSAFVLPVESQQIDRIMEKFSNRYHVTNPTMFQHADTAYVLSFAIIMLNTDLHNPSVKHRMTKQQFYKNNRGIDQGKDLPEKMLEKVYDSIKREQIRYPDDSSEEIPLEEYRSVIAKVGSVAATLTRRLSKRPASSEIVVAPQPQPSTLRLGRFGRRLSLTPDPSQAAAAAAASSAASAAAATAAASAAFNSVSTSSESSALSKSVSTRRTTSFIKKSFQKVNKEVTTTTSDSALPENTANVSVSASPKTEGGLKRAGSAPDVRQVLLTGTPPPSEPLDMSDAISVAESTNDNFFLETLGRSSFTSYVTNKTAGVAREGLLCKKNDLDDEGKRSTRRSWKILYCQLRDNRLVFCKTDTSHLSTQRHGSSGPYHTPPSDLVIIGEIHLEHAFAFLEFGHKDRPYVFRLVTAKKAAYLFQSVSQKDVNEWIATINKAAVEHSVFGGDIKTEMSKEAKLAAISGRIEVLEKKMKVETAYRDGIKKLMDQYKTNPNPAAEAESIDQHRKWEIIVQNLSDELRKLRCYYSIML